MIKFIFPDKDTFISNHPKLQSRNFGIDEILEVESRLIQNDNNAEYSSVISRALIKFDIDDIRKTILDNDIISPKFFLQLDTVESIDLPMQYELTCNPISQSWDVGQGRLYDDRTTDGVSWKFRDYIDGTRWAEYTNMLDSSSLEIVAITGGTWYKEVPKKYFGIPSASMYVNPIQLSDKFYLTSSAGDIYSYIPESGSVNSTPITFASASFTFTGFENFDRFFVNIGCEKYITAIANHTPLDCNPEYYLSGSWTTPVSESKLEVPFELGNMYEGKVFEISDSNITCSFIATKNTHIENSTCNVIFFNTGDDSWDSTYYLANSINNSKLHITASVTQSIEYVYSQENEMSQSFYYSGSELVTVETEIITEITSSILHPRLHLESIDSGERGNSYYIWDKDSYITSQSYDSCKNLISTDLKNKQYLVSGSGIGKLDKFNLLLSKLNLIKKSCYFNFTSSGYDILFATTAKGEVGNLFSFSQITSTETKNSQFNGGTSNTEVTFPSDDVSNRIYYFGASSSSLSSSLNSLSDKINSTANFVNTSVSESVISIYGQNMSIIDELITFQYNNQFTNLTGSAQWTTEPISAIQSFKNSSANVNMDVTTIVNSWVSGLIPNEGFILRHSDEFDGKDHGKLRFYSQNTNTIYVPRLCLKWNDQEYVSSSLTTVNVDDNIVVYVKNVKSEYKSEEVVRLYVAGKSRYQEQTFYHGIGSQLARNILPKESCYAIQDAESERMIVNFDPEYTSISCNGTESYFNFDMSALPQERYFRFLIKCSKNKSSKIFKDNGVFKISR